MNLIERVQIVAAAIMCFGFVGTFLPLRAQNAPSRSVWDGVYTQEQSRRGEALYGGECAKCHGTDLGGADEVPALSGGGFLSNWDGLTVGDLSERFAYRCRQTSRDG
jgi:hypothetical protein